MTAMVALDQSARFLRMLGDELRRVRRSRGWRRRDLRERLGRRLSVQAIATYELGTRACTIVRLLELTQGLEVSMPALLERTLERMPEIQPGVVVELAALAGSERAELGPLRRWARARLYHAKDRDLALVRFDRASFESLAMVCGLEPAELIPMVTELSMMDTDDDEDTDSATTSP